MLKIQEQAKNIPEAEERGRTFIYKLHKIREKFLSRPMTTSVNQ